MFCILIFFCFWHLVGELNMIYDFRFSRPTVRGLHELLFTLIIYVCLVLIQME